VICTNSSHEFFFPKLTFFPNSGELSGEFRVRVRVPAAPRRRGGGAARRWKQAREAGEVGRRKKVRK
jgi:hypothetical protein